MAEIPTVTKKIIAFGSKEIYLPRFTVALVRTPKLSPYHARFQVPLNFSKFDLRDYLYHAYNVKCFNIRSHVKQMPMQDVIKQQNHWFRPESKKYMTVEMEKPFVWPEKPESWAPWGNEEKRDQKQTLKELHNALDTKQKRVAAQTLKEQAQSLLRRVQVKANETAEREQAENAEVAEEKLERKTKTPVQEWEEKRPVKRVQGDEGPYLVQA